MSKFENGVFYSDRGGNEFYCVNKAKYTPDEAQAIAAYELDSDSVSLVADDWMVRYRVGVDEDGERRVGWWLEAERVSRGCEVWAFEQTNGCGGWQ